MPDRSSAAGSPAWRRQRRHLLAWLGGVPLVGGGCTTRPRAPAEPVRRDGSPATDQVVPFSISPANGSVPIGWEGYRVRRDIPESRYFTAAAQGVTVLRAHSERGASGLRCPVDADPGARPWIEWRWRVQAVPAGARAGDPDRDDSPARVVLAFDGDTTRLPLRERVFLEQVELLTGQRLPYAMLMYAWDATLPVAAVAAYPLSGRIRTLVVDSGAQDVGRWITHRRQFVDDFRRIFGEQPGRLVSVGVLTDADDLKQRMTADYGDIVLRAD